MRQLCMACTLGLFATSAAFAQNGQMNDDQMNNGGMNNSGQMDQMDNGSMDNGQMDQMDNGRYNDQYDGDTEFSGNMDEMDSAFGPEEGAWELILGGSGTSDKEFESGAGALNAEVGYYATDELEVGVRQQLGFASSPSNGSWNGRTGVFVDYHIDFDRIRPFVGLSVGYIYGDDTDDTGIAGPEIGAKYYVKDDTFIYGRASYQFLFESADDVDDQFDDGIFTYGLGIGFNF